MLLDVRALPVIRRVGGLEGWGRAADSQWGVIRRVGGLEGMHEDLLTPEDVIRRVGGLEAAVINYGLAR